MIRPSIVFISRDLQQVANKKLSSLSSFIEFEIFAETN